MTMKKTLNAGFTLVELAVVLVIIGLIIGGALNGKQIMRNAQITNAIDAIQSYDAQFQTYAQNFGAMPGDDLTATSRFENVTTNGNGNGTLQGSFDSETENDESRLVWEHLRAAGLVKGAVGSSVQPTNSFNGMIGFQHGAFDGTPSFTTNVLCLSKIPGDAAIAIDSRLDDGASDSGSIMGMQSTGATGEAVDGAVATGYDAAQTYTQCVRM